MKGWAEFYVKEGDEMVSLGVAQDAPQRLFNIHQSPGNVFQYCPKCGVRWSEIILEHFVYWIALPGYCIQHGGSGTIIKRHDKLMEITLPSDLVEYEFTKTNPEGRAY